jgi:O-acetyl-ADP-ribose deacetylase (regulator of RNase III)
MISEIIKGNIIDFAKEGMFDFIAHGCNTMCAMKSGVAVDMAKNFRCDQFPMEKERNVNKLGNIDSQKFLIYRNQFINTLSNSYKELESQPNKKFVTVVNAYTQAYPGVPFYGDAIPLSYEALDLCFQKINHFFGTSHAVLGLPYMIGCGLAGGDITRVKEIIEKRCTHFKKIIYCNING